MRKTVLLILLLGLALFHSSMEVYSAKAQQTQDGQGFPIAGSLSILSPSSSTYNSSIPFLNVTSTFLLTPNLAKFSYSLDGADNVMLPIKATFVPIVADISYANGTTEKGISEFVSYYILCGYTELPKLSNGSHRITVFAEYRANDRIGFDSRTVCFTVEENSSASTVLADKDQNLDADSLNDSVLDQSSSSSAHFVQSLPEPMATSSFLEPIVMSVSTAIALIIFPVAALVYWKKRKR